MTRYAWTRGEMDELERCYLAGMSWPETADAVAKVRGNRRTRNACRRKAWALSLTDLRPKGWAHRPDIGTDDIEDMVMLGYSSREMAGSLGISQRTVLNRVNKLSRQAQSGWRRTEASRRAKSAEVSWVKRRLQA